MYLWEDHFTISSTEAPNGKTPRVYHHDIHMYAAVLHGMKIVETSLFGYFQNETLFEMAAFN